MGVNITPCRCEQKNGGSFCLEHGFLTSKQCLSALIASLGRQIRITEPGSRGGGGDGFCRVGSDVATPQKIGGTTVYVVWLYDVCDGRACVSYAFLALSSFRRYFVCVVAMTVDD